MKRLLGKFFGSTKIEKSSKEEDKSPYCRENPLPVDELFIYNFNKNGGKFLYCSNLEELKTNFENILVEQDWFEKEALTYELALAELLKSNNIQFDSSKQPTFYFATCEALIADDGSILLSARQMRHSKPNELPENIIIYALASQIVMTKSDGLQAIKTNYPNEIPSNITTIKNFNYNKEHVYLEYGSDPKNLYLLLLEDF